MSQPKNKLEKKFSAIILSAGEGTRISDFIQNIPKPLIKVNNKPLLLHIISSLKHPAISSIIIIIGHLGNEIKKFIFSLKKTNASLYEKIMIINSGENYKKGPLYSFLSIVNEKEILKKDKIFLVIPGDTYFKPDLFSEIFNIMQKNFNTIKKRSIVFYQKVQGIKLKSRLSSKKQVSIIELEKLKSTEIIREIQQKNIDDIDDNEEINYVLPIFMFNYKFITKIINIKKKVSITTIREMINYLIQKEICIFFAYPISPHFRFIDIDTKSDLINIYQKKKDNRGSD